MPSMTRIVERCTRIGGRGASRSARRRTWSSSSPSARRRSEGSRAPDGDGGPLPAGTAAPARERGRGRGGGGGGWRGRGGGRRRSGRLAGGSSVGLRPGRGAARGQVRAAARRRGAALGQVCAAVRRGRPVGGAADAGGRGTDLRELHGVVVPPRWLPGAPVGTRRVRCAGGRRSRAGRRAARARRTAGCGRSQSRLREDGRRTRTRRRGGPRGACGRSRQGRSVPRVRRDVHFSEVHRSSLNGHNTSVKKNTSEWVFLSTPWAAPLRTGLRAAGGAAYPQLRPGGIATQLREAPAGRPGQGKGLSGTGARRPVGRTGAVVPARRAAARAAGRRPSCGRGCRQKSIPSSLFSSRNGRSAPPSVRPGRLRRPSHGRVAPVVARRFPARAGARRRWRSRRYAMRGFIGSRCSPLLKSTRAQAGTCRSHAPLTHLRGS